MESSGELDRFIGVSLCDENDPFIIENPQSFRTKPVFFRSLGKASLAGLREAEYEDEIDGIELGIKQDHGKSAYELIESGLYEIVINVDGIKERDQLVCRVFDPVTTNVYQSDMIFGEDDMAIGEDRYSVMSTKWKKEGEQTDGKVLCIPKDPKIISKLQFSFSSGQE